MVTYSVTCPFSGEKYTFTSKDAIRGFVASMMAQQPKCDKIIPLYADGKRFGTMRKVQGGAAFLQTRGKESYYVNKDGSLGSTVKETAGNSDAKPYYKVYVRGIVIEEYRVDDLDAFRKKFTAKHYRGFQDRTDVMYDRGARSVGVPVYRVKDGKERFVGSINFHKVGAVSWSPAKDIDVTLPFDPATGKLL